MDRPFTDSDGGKRFRFVRDYRSTSVSKFVGQAGDLEFPLQDPGSAFDGEGVLWFGPVDDRTGWDYVSPAEVEPAKE